MLAIERLKELLEYVPESGWFIRKQDRRKFKAGSRSGRQDSNGYRTIYIDGQYYLEHRLAWFYMTSKWPVHEIDHINLNKADNRWKNLREATHEQNTRNVSVKSNSITKIKNVGWHKASKKYRAQIRVNGERRHIGYFKNIEEAELAVIKAIKVYHQDFARIS